MSIPKNIKKENLIQAINKIDKEGIPADGASQFYDVLYNGKKYPPKLVISYANIFANGSELDRTSFKGGKGTPCFKVLEEAGFSIVEKENIPNIKLYDIHGKSTIENYRTLISKDNKFFYWDSKRFIRNELGDIVFWVNRTEKKVLYTIIDSKEIKPSFSDGRNIINDLGNNVFATAQSADTFENFYRFRIIHFEDIPDNWNYSNLIPFNGQTMAIILYEPKIKEPEKKIEKIEDLKIIFSKNKEVLSILNSAHNLLSSINTKKPSTNNRNMNKLDKSSISSHIESFIKSKGFNFKREEIANFYLSLKTKPFVILAGISGTGKTQLPRLFAEAVGMSKEQVIQVPVRPDWTDSSDLIGYTALNGQFISKPLTDAILKAKGAPKKPFFFILDEMNLARVEHYFSDFLSIIETRTHDDGKIITDPIITESQIKDAQNKEIFENLYWPENLYLIGTVNMDETTHPFSRKVLDRANSIEMNTVELDWLEKQTKDVDPLVDFTNEKLRGEYIGSKDLSETDKKDADKELNEIKEINEILRIADLHFAYRVRDEIIFYITYAKKEKLLDVSTALDFQFMQKILPRIHGSSIRTQKVLVGLINRFSGEKLSSENPDITYLQKNKKTLIEKSKYPKSLEKLIFMLERFEEDRFTSFWV
jgi:MoxR-like ATPase